MNRDKARQAVEEGIYDFIKDLVVMEAKNEATATGPVAEIRFANGLRMAKDALDRGLAEVDKIFPG
jgi:hypothetical protein